MSKVSIEHAGRKITAKYSQRQIDKSNEYVSALTRRHDVVQTIATLQGIKKPRLKRKEITARDGSIHDYLVVRKGRKRFLFDMPEDPTIQQEPSEMTWVVPQTTMRNRKLLPQDPIHFRRFRNFFDVQHFLGTIEHDGYFAGRYTGAAVEHNQEFIQPIPAIIVTNTKRRMRSPDTKILLPIRNHDTSANMDTRLAGMIVAPFAMGHSESHDFGHPRRLLKHTMYREVAEETAYTKDPKDPNKTFHVFPYRNGKYQVTIPGIFRLRQSYRFSPLGVIYIEDKEIDRVHTGVIYIAEPKRNDTTFTLNGKSRESLTPVWKSPREYANAIANDEYTPASWNQPIIQEGILPYITKRKERR